MITINIPESSSKVNAQDELVKHILDKLKKDGECSVPYLRDGCGAGNWIEGEHYWNWKECITHQSSLSVIEEVAKAFNDKGYIVQVKNTGVNYSSLFIK